LGPVHSSLFFEDERHGSEGGDDFTLPLRWTQSPLFCIR
jgi:hypothetical protein